MVLSGVVVGKFKKFKVLQKTVFSVKRVICEASSYILVTLYFILYKRCLFGTREYWAKLLDTCNTV